MNKNKIGCSVLIGILGVVAAFLAIPDNSLIVKGLNERTPTGNELIEIDIPTEPINIEEADDGNKRIEYEDGIYEGQTNNGKRNGDGIFKYKHKQAYYDGEWKNNRKDGEGKYEDEILIYVGEFQNGEFNGFGILTFKKSGNKYEGQFKNGTRNGIGEYYKMVRNTGNNQYYKSTIYQGGWENDLFHGEGTQYTEDGKFIGSFQNGKRHGIGYLYDNDKKLKIKQKYIKGDLYKSWKPEDI